MTDPRFEAPSFPTRTDPLRRWRHLAPDRIALVDRGRDERLTYAELDDRAEAWKGRLRELGVERGGRIATLARERQELVHLFFACGRLGAALVPLNWRLPPAELAGILALAGPGTILTGDGYRAAAEEALDRARSIEPGDRTGASRNGSVSDPAWVDLDAPPAPPAGKSGPDAAVDPETPHLILFTSGTTGRPKGVVLPHRQIFYNAVATTTAWQLDPNDVGPISTPLFHTGGWNVFATPLWHRGGRVVLMEGFDADAFLGILADEGCTVALVIPTQLRMIREGPEWGRPLPELRRFFSGGAPLAPELAASTREAGYAIVEGYGLTECGPNCFAISAEEARRIPGAVGRPMPFLQARLDAGDGSAPTPGEAGELLLRGPQMFGGYFREPERTASATTPDGWLRTGDLARRDQQGRYHICGRRKEMFISGGENVFPAEVESILSGCPGVSDVAVVGVPHTKWGEVGRAFVVPERGAEISFDALRSWASERLAGYKVPESMVALEEMPRLASGKPDRRALVDRHVETEADEEESRT